MENKSEKIICSSYKSSSCSLKSIRDDFKHFLNVNDIGDVNAGYIIIAVNEICMNIIQHADGGHYHGNIYIEAEITNDLLTITIEDEAGRVDINNLKGRDIDKLEPGGLGLHLVNDVMDTVIYSDNKIKPGNSLTMTKKIENHDEV